MSIIMKKPFGIKLQKPFSQKSIHSLIKSAAEGMNQKFDPNTIEQIIQASKTEDGSKFVVNSLVNIIDHDADNDSVVYKALKVFYLCLFSDTNHFRKYAELFLPEILSISTLSFKKPKDVKYRKQLHILSQNIYLNLTKNTPLLSPLQLDLEKYVSSSAILQSEQAKNKSSQQNLIEVDEINEPCQSENMNIHQEKYDTAPLSPLSNCQFVENLIEWHNPDEKAPSNNENANNLDDEILFPGLTQLDTSPINKMPKSEQIPNISRIPLSSKTSSNLTLDSDIFDNMQGIKVNSAPLMSTENYPNVISSAQSTSQILNLNTFDDFDHNILKEKSSTTSKNDFKKRLLL